MVWKLQGKASRASEVSRIKWRHIFGKAQVSNLVVLVRVNKKRIEALTSSLSKLTNKSTYLSWAKYFVEGVGQNNLYQLDSFLAY